MGDLSVSHSRNSSSGHQFRNRSLMEYPSLVVNSQEVSNESGTEPRSPSAQIQSVIKPSHRSTNMRRDSSVNSLTASEGSDVVDLQERTLKNSWSLDDVAKLNRNMLKKGNPQIF